MTTRQREYLLIALALLLGSVVIWSAVQFKTMGTQAPLAPNQVAITRSAGVAHLYGSKRAPIRIVTFSDYSCGFCARLHPTLKQVVDDANGAVAWEYRHFPILHELSTSVALVSECVAREVNNEAFWSFTETVLQNQSQLSDSYLRQQALALGMPETALDMCLSDATITTLVDSDQTAARALGARGTPYSVVVQADGSVEPVSGALSYAEWQNVLTRNTR